MAVAHGLAIDHPGLGHGSGQRQAGRRKGVEQLAPEHGGQCVVVEEVAATAARSTPAGAPGAPGGPGLAARLATRLAAAFVCMFDEPRDLKIRPI